MRPVCMVTGGVTKFAKAHTDRTIAALTKDAFDYALHDDVNLRLSDIDMIELNEAFAAQALAVMRVLAMDPALVNVHGGAIALGHPLGCTGAKLTTQLVHAMPRRKARFGMVTMCVGGGMGAAGIFENLN